jgi:hypothetical protein
MSVLAGAQIQRGRGFSSSGHVSNTPFARAPPFSSLFGVVLPPYILGRRFRLLRINFATNNPTLAGDQRPLMWSALKSIQVCIPVETAILLLFVITTTFEAVALTLLLFPLTGSNYRNAPRKQYTAGGEKLKFSISLWRL